MNEKQKGADLNEPKIEKDVYNRAQEIVRILTESQLLIMRGDMLGDLNSMYHGCQGMLDVVQGDFVERVKEKDGKTHIYKGMKTTKFRKYRQILDQANNQQLEVPAGVLVET